MPSPSPLRRIADPANTRGSSVAMLGHRLTLPDRRFRLVVFAFARHCVRSRTGSLLQCAHLPFEQLRARPAGWISSRRLRRARPPPPAHQSVTILCSRFQYEPRTRIVSSNRDGAAPPADYPALHLVRKRQTEGAANFTGRSRPEKRVFRPDRAGSATQRHPEHRTAREATPVSTAPRFAAASSASLHLLTVSPRRFGLLNCIHPPQPARSRRTRTTLRVRTATSASDDPDRQPSQSRPSGRQQCHEQRRLRGAISFISPSASLLPIWLAPRWPCTRHYGSIVEGTAARRSCQYRPCSQAPARVTTAIVGGRERRHDLATGDICVVPEAPAPIDMKRLRIVSCSDILRHFAINR